VAIAVAILLLLVNFWLQVWLFLAENATLIAQIFLGGLLASIVSALLYASIVEKPVWRRDLKSLTELVSELSKDVEKVTRDYTSLMGALPDAIGGRFTKSLFEYPPTTSRKLAEILSEQTRNWYRRHYKRVLVIYAEDVYRLCRVRETKDAARDVGGTEGDMLVWELEFQTTWKWVNDCEVTAHPLGSLRIILSAPDEAIENFLTATTSERRAEQRKRFFEFTRSANMVRSLILHKNIAQPLHPDVIPKLFDIHEFEVDFRKGQSSSVVCVPAARLIKLAPEEVPAGVYAGYRLPEDVATLPLEKGAEVIINYRGRIALPVFGEAGEPYGMFNFPPSDVIAERYSLKLIYPETIDVQGKDRRLGIRKKDSGCWLVNERVDYKFVDIDEDELERVVRPLPKEPALEARKEHAVELVVPGPLTDLNYISILWEGK
jgi:hypothetical protein